MINELYFTLVKAVYHLIKEGHVLQATDPLDNLVSIGPYREEQQRQIYALFIGPKRVIREPGKLTLEFVKVIGLEKSLEACLASMVREAPDNHTVSNDGVLMNFHPKTCGYCFFRIPHRFEEHQMARVLSLRTMLWPP